MARIAQITSEEIAEAALTLIDEEGLGGFSTRKLAAKLGIQAMSLYHYYKNLEAIQDAVVEYLIGKIELPAPSTDWQKAMLELANGFRQIGLTHPEAIPLLAVRCPASPNMRKFLNSICHHLLEAGLSPEKSANWMTVQGNFIIGSMMSDHAALCGGQSAPSGKVPLQFPSLTKVQKKFNSQSRDIAFQSGLSNLHQALKKEISECLKGK